MRGTLPILLTALLLSGAALAQQSPSDKPSSKQPPADQSSTSQTSTPPPANQSSPNQTSSQLPPANQPPPESAQEQKAEREKSVNRSAEAGESSSRDTQIDTSPPKNDAKDHRNGGGAAVSDSSEAEGDVQETHPWNPYRAMKDDEVADFYYKQKDYKGALARWQDALVYKNNDAVANFRLGECYEKLGQPEKSIPYYQEYLKILPEGPYAKRARKALAKLGAPEKPSSQKITPQ